MLRKFEKDHMGKSDLFWLNSNFHFSFEDYFDPKRMNFGALRVLNDNVILSCKGFDTHPHKDMEIISYVTNGELTYEDSMNNKNILKRGDVQYICAGSGIFYSEYNFNDHMLRFIQIWIIPEEENVEPNYIYNKIPWKHRKNKWLHIVCGKKGLAPIKINRDANIYVSELEENKELSMNVNKHRQGYLLQIEGCCSVNNVSLNSGEALEIIEEDLLIKAKEDSHLLIVEMNKSKDI